MTRNPIDIGTDVHQRFGRLLSAMIRSFLNFEKSKIFNCGVTMSQCSTILAIGKRVRMTMNELSDCMSLASSTMTRIVDKLVRDGYIERSQDDQDRRVVHVSLTEKGKGLFKVISRIYDEFHRRIIESIPPGEIPKIADALSTLKEAIEGTPLTDPEGCAEES